MSTSYSQTKDVQDFQIMEETTRGTFIVPGAATNATFVTKSAEIGYDSELNPAINRIIGSRDPAHVIPTLDAIRFSLMVPNWYPTHTTNFFKRGVNLEAGAGTVQMTFSGALRMKLGATQYYLTMKRMIVGAGMINLIGQGYWNGQIWMAGEISNFTTSAPTNWTFVDAPATNTWAGMPIGSADAGASAIIIRDVDTATNYTPDISSVTIGFNNGLFPIPKIGGHTVGDIIPTGRAIRVRFTENFITDNIFAIHRNRHQVNSYITIDTSGSHSFVGTGGVLSPFSLPSTQDTSLMSAYTQECVSGILA